MKKKLLGGELSSAYVDSITTDYLRANRFGIFSMSLDLFEKAGYLDLLDQKGDKLRSFFVSAALLT